MGMLIVAGVVMAIGGVVQFVRAGGRQEVEAGREIRTDRRTALALIGAGATVALVALGLVVARDLERRDRPPPSFASLADRPDPSLRGTVAYISEAKKLGVQERQACARVVAASGAASQDVLCWPIDGPALATTVWLNDGRLLVTSFAAPVGKNTLVPEWAKVVDVTSGRATEVPAAELGKGARPPAGPAANPDGERLIREGADGNVHVLLSGPSGARTLLKIEDANPSWSIQSGPVWSPDFEWILMWDGTRLLVTTVEEPTTRELVQEASGGAFAFDVPTFDITERDLLAG